MEKQKEIRKSDDFHRTKISEIEKLKQQIQTQNKVYFIINFQKNDRL